MKWLVRAVLIVLVLSFGLSAAEIEPVLVRTLAAAEPNEKFPVEFIMNAQANALSLDATIPNLPKPERRARVRTVLEGFAEGSQRDLLAYLKAKAASSEVECLHSLWLVNMVHCWATRDVIYEVAARPDVKVVMYSKQPVELGDRTLKIPPTPRDGVEPNLQTTNAPGAWKQGYTGQGTTVGLVDTGTWYTHMDLRNHLWTSPAYPLCGYNFASVELYPSRGNTSPYDTLDPKDYYGHGTHTSGIVGADGNYGNGTHDTMGVAPSTKIMMCAVLVYLVSPYPDTVMEDNMISGFQFCVSPTRDPTNGADVISTSLGLTSAWLPRRDVFRACEENIEAAGVTHCVAAGNEASARTIRTPGDCPPPWPNPANNPTDHGHSAVITVGATDNLDNAASFTSKGPSDWGSVPPYNDYVYPPGLIDPDVCCPGVNITSTYMGGDSAYTQMSGTSMATPGTAGCVALMYSKNPNLTPRQVDSILEMTSHDLGTSGKDNTFGQGRINCSLAVAMTPLPSGLQLLSRVIDDAAGNGDGIVNPGEAINVPTSVINMDAFAHNGVTGKIVQRGSDPLFTITDSLKAFGDIPANESASTGTNGFKFTVDPSATDGHLLQMNLILKDAADSTWVSGFDFTVGAPDLVAAGVVVKDSASGNGNGIVDPGETADLLVVLKNKGQGNAYAVAGDLVSSNPAWLTVPDPDGAYDTILRGVTKGNTADHYTVTADPSAPSGSMIPCTLHVSATGYTTTVICTVAIGVQPQAPGTIIWGPKTIPNAPAVYGLYGLAYDRHNDRLYATHFRAPTIFVMSSDSFLTSLGTIPAPNNETACTDIKYCAYDNTFWVAQNDEKRIYKIDTAGHVLRYFANPASDYPVGLGWDENTRTLYLTDRRSVGVNPGYIYTCDTMGNVELTVATPFISYAGIRTLGLDITNTNPLEPTLVNCFTWFDPSSAALDSVGIYELKRDTWDVLNHFLCPDLSGGNPWNVRGVEYDPRDGSLWIGIMQNPVPPPADNSIYKCWGFHYPTAIAERDAARTLPGRLWVQARPNPFRGGTAVSYNLPIAQRATVRVYDAAGREVRSLFSGSGTVGEHAVTWNGLDAKGRTVAPGIYFVRCETDNASAKSKLILLE